MKINLGPIFIAAIFLFSCAKFDYDLLIINGTIIDGSGSISYKADIGIIDDRIITMEIDLGEFYLDLDIEAIND